MPTDETGAGDTPPVDAGPAPDAVPESAFLEAVRGMVRGNEHGRPAEQRPPARRVATRAERRAARQAQRHNEKIEHAERRNARRSRKARRAAPRRDQSAAIADVALEAAVEAKPTDAPAEPQRIPAQATGPVAARGAGTVPGRSGRRAQRRDATRSAVLGPDPAVDPDGDPADEPLQPLGSAGGTVTVARTRSGRAARRRARRLEAARAVAESVPAVEDDDPGGRADRHGAAAGPPDGHDGPRPRGRRRRIVKLTVAGLVVAACAALPWLAPVVPHTLADLVPGHGSQVPRVQDPPVSPSTEAFTGPVGLTEQSGPYAGVRLLAAGWPRQVVVPRLHVDSRVIAISGQSGSLLPPDDPQQLGWWREGQPVGAQYGTAVITGHTVHTGGGALDHLDKLVVGDSLRVRTDDGWIRYVVQHTRIYSTAELAREAQQLFRRGGNGRLVVITCDDWNGTSYESNAVVFATPVLDQPFDSTS